jgi:hypothetical protein
VLSATDEAAASAELERSGVDWVLLCPGAVERDVFAAGAASAGNLYRRLVDGAPPAWLQRLPLPPGVGPARLFAVVPDASAPLAEAAPPADPRF